MSVAALDLAGAPVLIPGPRSVQRSFELTRLDRLLPSATHDQQEGPCQSMMR